MTRLARPAAALRLRRLARHLIPARGIAFLLSILAGVVSPPLGIPLRLTILPIGTLGGEDGRGIAFDKHPLANIAATAHARTA